jgi:hypothetical protein
MATSLLPKRICLKELNKETLTEREAIKVAPNQILKLITV